MHDPASRTAIHHATSPQVEPSSFVADADGLTCAALPLVETVARALWLRWGRAHDLDELEALGRAALVSAVRAYDPDRAPFVPYIVQRVRWAIQDGVRAMSRARGRRPRPTSASAGDALRPVDASPGAAPDNVQHRRELGLRAVGSSSGWGAARVNPEAGSPEAFLMAEREAERVRRAVARLPCKERVLVVSHYFQGRRFDRVAAHLGISKSWASRLHARALRRLSRALGSGGGGPSGRWGREGCRAAAGHARVAQGVVAEPIAAGGTSGSSTR